MKKGVVALLLLFYVGLLTPSNSTEQDLERLNEVLEVMEETLDEARNGHIWLPDVEEQRPPSAETEQASSSVIYTIWGNSSCPSTSTVVYSGRAGGAYFTHAGSGSNYLCLPSDPEYYSDGKPTTYPAYVYSSEYETWGTELTGLENHNVPCAVCEAQRQAMIMVPAKITCPTGWTREYNGFLMASYFAAQAKRFVCVDHNPERARGGAPNHDGAAFYRSRLGNCFGLECPPYDTKKDLACVVCTK